MLRGSGHAAKPSEAESGGTKIRVTTEITEDTEDTEDTEEGERLAAKPH